MPTNANKEDVFINDSCQLDKYNEGSCHVGFFLAESELCLENALKRFCVSCKPSTVPSFTSFIPINLQHR